MHSIESLGLHKDFEEMSRAVGAPHLLETWEIPYRNRLFWCCWAFHQSLAVETGRSAVMMEDITVQNPWDGLEDNATASMVELSKVIPPYGVTHLLNKSMSEQSQFFTDSLKKMRDIRKPHPIVALNAADIASSIYRRLLVAGARKNVPHQLADLGSVYEEALLAAETLLEAEQAWWQLVDTTFQLTCVLISLDSPQTLELLRRALTVMDKVSDHFQTDNSSDAVSTCRVLVRALTAKKQRELLALQDLSLVPPMPQQRPEDMVEQAMTDDPLFSGAEMPDLFSQFSGPFEWAVSASVIKVSSM